MRNVDVKTQTMDSECLGEERGKSTARNLLIDGYCALCSEGLEQEEQEVIDCSEIVQCYFCKDSFHAINCKDDSCNVSATSVFKNQLSPAVNNTSSYERRFGRFLFMCDDCITLEEKKRASATADRVQLLDAKFDSFKQDYRREISELKNLLKQHLSSDNTVAEETKLGNSDSPTTVKPSKELWSQRVQNLKHMVTIKTKANGTPLSPLVLEKTCIDSGASVVKTFALPKSKDTGILCNSRKDAEVLMEKFGETLPSNEVELVTARKPEINVVGLTREYSSSELTEMIKKQNDGISNLLEDNTALLDDKFMKVISITKVKSYKGAQQTPYKATIRVSNLIRDLIHKQGDRLYLGLQTCKVYDAFFVPRCYKCQEFGHHSKNCSRDRSICGFCAQEHETKSCTIKSDSTATPTCINCKNCGKKETNHYAGSFVCPILIAKQNELKKRIPFHQCQKRENKGSKPQMLST